MATKQYVVCPGRSVQLPGSGTKALPGKIIKAGTKLPDGVPQKNIKEWLNTGFIRQIGGAVEIEEATTVLASESTGNQDLVKAGSASQPIAQPGKFNLDPNELEGRSLEELNTMLVDLGAEIVDTEEEAIALLSADRSE